MPYCPVCKNEYTDQQVCPIDKVELVDELPYQTIEGEDGTWVEISSASTEDEARLLQGFLQSQGIDCHIESLKFHMEPVNFGSMGEIRLYVRAQDEATAVELLRERDEEFESSERDQTDAEDDEPAPVSGGD